MREQKTKKSIHWKTEHPSNWRTWLEVILGALVLILAGVLVFGGKSKQSAVKLVLYTPEETITKSDLEPGTEVSLEPGPEIEGYVFIGWRGEDGQMETNPSVTVYEDTYYSAVYTVGLNTEKHIVFLDNVDGLFRPGDSLTRREAAVAIYRLMDRNTVSDERFKDVPEDDECFAATSTLKNLGILSGNYFHPDEAITRGDFLKLLTSFFPVSGEECVFSDLDNKSEYYQAYCTAAANGWITEGENTAANPYEEIARSETATIVCRALGRTGDTEGNTKSVGTFLDVSQKDENFWPIAESTIRHDFRTDDGKEIWTKSDYLPSYEPGFFYVGVVLHYIDETGEPVIGKSVEYMDFNERGEITSGDSELDKYIRAVLKDVLLEEGETDLNGKDEHVMLKQLFDYVSDQNTYNYLSRNKYEVGDISWVKDEALTMLKTKKGNCYNFAAVFYELARAIGYDAQIFSGTMGLEGSPHAWVEIEHNGMMCLYDTEDRFAHPDRNSYERDPEYMARYHYHKNGREE